MHKVEPKVFIVGESKPDQVGIAAFMREMSYPETWRASDYVKLDTSSVVALPVSGAEHLTEFYGRLCYRSFAPGLNANVTKIREGNCEYIANVMKSKHGSVLEHATVNFAFANVSRVLTHELVRHRVGTAISQESLRYVRLDDLGLWAPTCISEDEHAMTIFARTFEELEKLQLELAEHFKLDEPGTPFSKKKEITSAMRRIAPDGLATSIGWTANHRTIRFVLDLRTDPGAEEEIRRVFDQVGQACKTRFPNIYQDFVREENGHWKSETWKV